MGSWPRDRILDVIYVTIEELNEELEPEVRLERAPETMLYGEYGQLDSLRLVQLLVAAEQRIEDEFGVSLILADEHALARTTSPFRSVGTLADYVADRLEG
jgi:D-alanine--poly(phosphoribitol) ligase subunit 2